MKKLLFIFIVIALFGCITKEGEAANAIEAYICQPNANTSIHCLPREVVAAVERYLSEEYPKAECQKEWKKIHNGFKKECLLEEQFNDRRRIIVEIHWDKECQVYTEIYLTIKKGSWSDWIYLYPNRK